MYVCIHMSTNEINNLLKKKKMHRPICNKVQLNNNDESNKVNDICIYNRDFPPNINKNNMMINNNNNIKKKE